MNNDYYVICFMFYVRKRNISIIFLIKKYRGVPTIVLN